MAAINIDVSTRDEAGALRNEKGHRCRDFLRRSEPFEQRLRYELRARLLVGDTEFLCLHVRQIVHPLGQDRTRINGIDEHVGLRTLLGKRLRQVEKARIHNAGSDRIGVREQTVRPGEIDDPTAPAADHARENRACAADLRHQLDVDRGLPIFIAQRREIRGLGTSAVVHQDVDRPQPLLSLLDEPIDVLRARPVGRNTNDLGAFFSGDPAYNSGKVVGAPRRQSDPRTLAGQFLCNRQPETTPTCCNERNFVGQSEIHATARPPLPLETIETYLFRQGNCLGTFSIYNLVQAPVEMRMPRGGNTLDVNEQRLWRRHIELAKIGGLTNGGTNRQALTPEEATARRLIAQWAEELKCKLYADDIGNLFISRPGTDPAAPPVMTGSHIDTQPTGGKFDGCYGVLAGLEVLQVLNEANVRTRRGIEVVIWMNEEGCRFAPGMMGSEAFAGIRDVKDILAVEDANGLSVAAELPAILAATPHAVKRPIGFPIAAFIEAHIEQGPILEAENCVIGVVNGIQGTRRFRVRVVGEEAHAGTTPRSRRKDAMSAAAHMLVAMQESVEPYQEDVRFTVGMWKASPNVPGVVASEVLFSIDLRHPETDIQKRIGDGLEAICQRNTQGCGVTIWEIASAPSIHFPQEIVSRIRNAAARRGVSQMDILSGAGHDARQLHYVCPTGMIFVPCERGISHNEAENAKPSDLAAGANVLCDVLVDLANA